MNKILRETFILLTFFILLNKSFQKNLKLNKKDIEKIKKGVFLDSYMLSLNELYYNNTKLIKTEEQSHIPQRKLADEITLTNVGFFSYDLTYANRIVWSYGNIFNNINKDTTKYIIYPYAFTYKTIDENNEV